MSASLTGQYCTLRDCSGLNAWLPCVVTMRGYHAWLPRTVREMGFLMKASYKVSTVGGMYSTRGPNRYSVL